jgi:RecA-family ATPase
MIEEEKATITAANPNNSVGKDTNFSDNVSGRDTDKFRMVDGQRQFFHERKGLWMPCDAVPDGDCPEYRTIPDGTLGEIVGIPQTSDTDNVSDEPPADFSPPDYDPFGDEAANEAPAPQPSDERGFSFAEIEAANRRLENSVTGDATEQRPWITARELLENPVTELHFLVEGLFPQVGIAACVGDSDVGKSALLRQLCLSIVTGKPDFAGFKLNTKYEKALYVSTEDGKEAINFLLGKQNSRMQAELADLEGLDFTFIEDFGPRNAPQVIEERIRSAGAVDLVVLDGYGDLLNGDPNNFQQVRKFLQPYREIANRHECLIIFLHHVKKSARLDEPGKHNVNGSQGFEAAMRTVIELREEKENPHIKHLCITKGNYISKAAKTDSFQLCFDEATLTFSNTGERVSFDLLVPQSQSGDERRQKYEKAKELKARGFTQEQIAKELGYKNRGSVCKLLKTYGADS